MQKKRPSRESCLIQTAILWSKRGTCLRSKVGCVIEKNGRIISIGYVGSPPGQPHCLEVGCLMKEGSCVRGIHAEANAIGFASRNGIPTEGATLYTTLSPCIKCSQLIIASGIKRVIYVNEYRDLSGIEYLSNNGIEVIKWEDQLEKGGD